MSDLTAVSLFAGVGGFDLALERSDVEVVAAVEIDPACRSVLRRHFPRAAIFEDVTEVTGDQLRAAGFVPGRGIICGGWPCQGNSVAGRRGGMADPRSGLWRHVVRLLAEARPRWFLGENVPGLLSINEGRDFGTVISDLDDLGYGMAWRVLDAQWFGLAQQRRRVFVAGCLGDPIGPVQVLLEPEGGEWHPAAGSEAGARAPRAPGLGAIATLQGGGRRGYRIDAEGAAGGHLIAFPVALRGRQDGSQIEVGELGDPAFTVRTPGGGSSVPMVGQATRRIAQALTSNYGKQPDNSDTNLGPTLVSLAMGFAENQRGEVVETPVSHQLTTGGGKPGQGYPAVRQASVVRRLTPLECERLQGFPDEWTRWDAGGAEQSDSARYRQLGNAVAVPCVEWITRRIVAVEASLSVSRGVA